MNWLCDRTMAALGEVDPEMSEADGLVIFTLSPALHAALSAGGHMDDGSLVSPYDDPGRGWHLMLTFYAYGDDEAQSMAMLDRVFCNIDAACRSVSREVGKGLAPATIVPTPDA